MDIRSGKRYGELLFPDDIIMRIRSTRHEKHDERRVKFNRENGSNLSSREGGTLISLQNY